MSDMYRQWAKTVRTKARVAEASHRYSVAADLRDSADRWEHIADAHESTTGD